MSGSISILNCLAERASPPIGQGIVNRLESPRQSASEGMQTNALAGSSAPPTPAPPPQIPPVMPPPRAPMPAPHPADDMQKMAQAVALSAPPEETLRQVADGQEHAIHAVGPLLRKPGKITQSDLNSTFATALGTGKITKDQTVAFSLKLPPASNQAALRSTLETQLERSIRALVVIHGEAQRRGIDLSGRTADRAN